jgi:hypothetical protein
MGCSCIVNAKQLQTSSFYDVHGTFHNASTAGNTKTNYVGAHYKTQWSGINGRPTTATVYGSFKLPKQQLGIGGYLYNDVTGPITRTRLQIAIAKHINLTNGAVLSFDI